MIDIQKIIEKNLKRKSLISYMLLPASWIYSLITVIRRKYYIFFNLGYHSKIKIISVGNIISGGTGKTPFVIFLADYLRTQGYKIAISHRGYKGAFEKKTTLISDRKGLFNFAYKAGDESYLIAKKLKGIPVICGKNRKLAIKILEKKFPDSDYIILDDSFQHLKVKHFLDIILFNELSFIGNGFVLPAGILREPLSSLKYADLVVYNGKSIPDLLKSLPVLKASYQVKDIYDTNKKKIKIKKLQQSAIALISGIGNPLSFENTVKNLGLDFDKHFTFPDHFNYDKNSLKKVMNYLTANNIKYLLTTEKDFDKLKKFNLPLCVIAIEFKISNIEILKEYL